MRSAEEATATTRGSVVDGHGAEDAHKSGMEGILNTIQECIGSIGKTGLSGGVRTGLSALSKTIEEDPVGAVRTAFQVGTILAMGKNLIEKGKSGSQDAPSPTNRAQAKATKQSEKQPSMMPRAEVHMS